jgi:HAD superfamily hydrolase (TIGR01509 family)
LLLTELTNARATVASRRLVSRNGVPPRPPFPPEGVVFDLDGLLVDSEDAWGRAERRVVLELGYAWDPSVRPLLLGRGPRDAARVLGAFLGGHDPDDIDRRLLAAAEIEFASGLTARPGAAELVGALGDRLALAVATNSRRVLAELALAAAGLSEAFTAAVCAEDVAAPKPAPDPYATACQRLGCDPRRAIGLEDSPVGVASAKAAGLWVVGCPSFPGQTLAEADVVVDSLAELDVTALC